MSTVETAPTGPTGPVGSTGPARTPRIQAVLRFRQLGIVLALAVLVAFTTASNARFLSGQNVRDILLATSIVAVLAVGMAVVVITRNIDLSVGSVLGLSAYTAGSLLQDHPGTPIVFALLVGALVGAVCGVLNGSLVRFGQVPSLVVTLGTLYVYRGIGYLWAGGQQINADELPDGFLRFGTESLLGVPYLVAIALVAIALTGYFLANYRSGRDIYAMGSDPQAARRAGIPFGRRILAAFVFSGTMAGLAGVLFAARYGTVDAAAGTGYELNVVAAVVIGGVAVSGGSGNVAGAAIGALTLATIGSALAVLNINQFWQQAIVGALILAAIGTDRAVQAQLAGALLRRSGHGR